jgi:ribosomal protein S27AE
MLKERARSFFHFALGNGFVERINTCCDCGKDSVDAHHEDYTKPLEVIWLCRRCHCIRHAQSNRNPPDGHEPKRIIRPRTVKTITKGRDLVNGRYKVISFRVTLEEKEQIMNYAPNLAWIRESALDYADKIEQGIVSNIDEYLELSFSEKRTA